MKPDINMIVSFAIGGIITALFVTLVLPKIQESLSSFENPNA